MSAATRLITDRHKPHAAPALRFIRASQRNVHPGFDRECHSRQARQEASCRAAALAARVGTPARTSDRDRAFRDIRPGRGSAAAESCFSATFATTSTLPHRRHSHRPCFARESDWNGRSSRASDRESRQPSRAIILPRCYARLARLSVQGDQPAGEVFDTHGGVRSSGFTEGY